ncbi:hypothetical protein DVH24_017950 [Malus domestica]|uniref:Uncharacterized protein n=1 Tax=Malus domestica TaxID=3750 RepID=A0A498KE88_MALDO|nr:hypothetical protein DVH24_017950 [Malus domestica]
MKRSYRQTKVQQNKQRRISSDLETQIASFFTDLENCHEYSIASLSYTSINFTVIYVPIGRFLLCGAMFSRLCKNNASL